MTYKDAELMNQSFSGLANTIMQQRQLAERKKEREQGRQDQLRQEGVAAQYRNDTLAQRAKSETDTSNFRNSEMQLRNKEFASKVFHDTVNHLSSMAKDGLLDADKATQGLKEKAQQMQQSMGGMLDDDPMFQMVNAPDFALHKPVTDIQPKEMTFGNTKVVYDPKTGHFEVEKSNEPKPVPGKEEIRQVINPAYKDNTNASPFLSLTNTTKSIPYGQPGATPPLPGQTPSATNRFKILQVQ